MAEGRRQTAGQELGWLMANLAAMNPHLPKRRYTAQDFDPYAEARGPDLVTSDINVLIRLFKAKPRAKKEKHGA
jgi:hypothetical protein